MLFVLAILSSTLLTLQNAWSQQIGLDGAEIIDGRNMTNEEISNKIKSTLSNFASQQMTAHQLVSNDLNVQGLKTQVKKFIVLNPVDDGAEDYNATLIAASVMKDSYRAPDKKKHVQYGYGIGLAGTVAIRSQLNGVFDRQTVSLVSRSFGAMLSCFTGAGKEWIYDRQNTKSHTVDRKDFYATCAGGAGMMLVPFNFSF